MNANPNPYLKFCCLAALFAPTPQFTCLIPLHGAVSVDPVTGTRVSVEISVVRSGSQLNFEAHVSRTQEGEKRLVYQTNYAVSPQQVLHAYAFDVLTPLFEKIYADTWLWVFDPEINVVFYSPADMLRWTRSLRSQLIECEQQLRGKEDSSLALVESLEAGVVYVVVANDCERVKEYLVFTDEKESKDYFLICKEVYGGANVFWAPKKLDSPPENLARRLRDVKSFVAAVEGTVLPPPTTCTAIVPYGYDFKKKRPF